MPFVVIGFIYLLPIIVSFEEHPRQHRYPTVQCGEICVYFTEVIQKINIHLTQFCVLFCFVHFTKARIVVFE